MSVWVVLTLIAAVSGQWYFCGLLVLLVVAVLTDPATSRLPVSPRVRTRVLITAQTGWYIVTGVSILASGAPAAWDAVMVLAILGSVGLLVSVWRRTRTLECHGSR